MMMKSKMLSLLRTTTTTTASTSVKRRSNNDVSSLSRMMIYRHNSTLLSSIPIYFDNKQKQKQEIIRRDFVSATRPCQIGVDIGTCFTVALAAMGDTTVQDATLVAWNVQLGQVVNAGDLVAEFTTDKATLEFYAPEDTPEDGYVTQKLVDIGDIIEINQDFMELCNNVQPPEGGDIIGDGGDGGGELPPPETNLNPIQQGGGGSASGDESTGNEGTRYLRSAY